jgi:hypothetical protein
MVLRQKRIRRKCLNKKRKKKKHLIITMAVESTKQLIQLIPSLDNHNLNLERSNEGSGGAKVETESTAETETAAPRRRGRPRKEVVNAAPRRRGRPPTKEVVEVRGRGRPRKQVEEKERNTNTKGENHERRRPGRKKNIDLLVQEKQEEEERLPQDPASRDVRKFVKKMNSLCKYTVCKVCALEDSVGLMHEVPSNAEHFLSPIAVNNII